MGRRNDCQRDDHSVHLFIVSLYCWISVFPAANGLSIFVAKDSRHSSKAIKCKRNFVSDTNGPEVAIKISKFQVIT